MTFLRRDSGAVRKMSASVCLLLATSLLSAQPSGDAYVQPRSGWLFVVDSNNYKAEGRLLVVDPDEGKVVWSRATGHLPDLAVAPNGSRLYLAAGVPGPDARIEVIDAVNGQTVQTIANPNRAVSTGGSYMSRMALSSNGRWLYQAKMDNAPGNVTYYVDSFDTEQNRFLAHRTVTPLCVWPTLLPPSDANRLDIVCNETLDVRSLRPREPSAATSRVLLGSGAAARALRSRPPATALVVPEAQAVTVVMGDGRFIKANLTSRQITETDLIDRVARGVTDEGSVAAAKQAATTTPASASDWFAGRWLRQQLPLLSPDGAQLYVATSSLAALSQGKQPFEEIVVLNPDTLNLERKIPTGGTFQSMTLSRDGSRLFVVDTDTGTLKVLNATNGQVLRTFKAGVSPVFAIVNP